MSRLIGKSVIPMSLMKEKENKTATASRSASCSIGKWGNLHFTSTRYSSLQTVVAQTANEDINKKDASFDRDRSVSPPAEPVKPKKFFKSRNTQARVIIIPTPSDVSSSAFETQGSGTPSTTAPTAAASRKGNTPHNNQQQQQNYFHYSTERNNENKRSEEVKQRVNSSSAAVGSRKVKKEREKVVKEPKEQPPQPVEPPKAQGTRTSTRNKKIVNYNLEEDSIFCRSRERDKKEITSSDQVAVTVPPPTSSTQNESNVDHPPIVLRISKGTSQLVNTDNCPSSTAPSNTPSTTAEEETNNKPSSTSTRKEPNYSELNYCTVKISPDKPPKERLKLIIKTADLTAQICHEPAQPVDHDDNSRSLISPSFVSDKDFDSQSSVIGILSPMCSPTTTTVAPPLKSPETETSKKRTSSRTTKTTEPIAEEVTVAPTKSPKTYGRKKRKTNLVVEDVEVEHNNSEITPPLRIVPIKKIKKSKIIEDDFSQTHDLEVQHKEEVGSVKLVISKKKGSIYKSRTEEAVTKKKHMYKHTWDVDDDDNLKKFRNDESNESEAKKAKVNTLYDDFNTSEEEITSPIHNQISSTSSYSMSKNSHSELKVKNVKTAHQIQEIGEFQEMDDDIEYILDALQSHNQIPTRCLSALQLASKCMTPAFRMHVRAHGTVTKFFRALQDSKNDLSLGLCTSTIMYTLSQDALNMDLDRDSLELMLNLLEVNSTMALSNEQSSYFEKTKAKVREICEEIKNQGKGEHLNLDTISVGTLAMETLLSLTSKRAGTWFIEDLRELGGIEHIIKTICEYSVEISEYVVSWTEMLLTKLKTIERCLRVLENVTQGNEKNQTYIIQYNQGEFLEVLFKLLKLCDSEMAIHPTTDTTAKDSPGVILREALIPILKVLMNLTHTYISASSGPNTTGSCIFGKKKGLFDICFHILLQASNYVPEKCLFEFNLLVLLLLINLTMYVEENRTSIMNLIIKSSSGKNMSAIESLVSFFYKCMDMANVVEQNTDEILENTNSKKKDDMDETVNNLLKTAGHHMEYTMKASYTGIVIGNIIKTSNYEQLIRKFMRDNKFSDMVVILEKYYNFMNYTVNSEATVVAHMKSTKDIIEHFKEIDVEDIP